MAGKFVGLVSSKVALAAMGGLLLAGAVSTVAFAAPGQNTTSMALLGSMHTAASHGKGKNHNTSNHTHGQHSETVAIQGTLTQYDTTGGTIVVTGKAEDNDNHGHSKHDTDGASGGTASCTLTSPFTITLGANTKINGQAKAASDLTNDVGHKVEVQAQEGTNCTLTATKVTVAAAMGQSNNKSHAYAGTVASVGTSSFTLQPKHGSPITVDTTSTTKFSGHVRQLGDLKVGMHVVVHGTMASGNTVQANRVNSNGHVHLH